MSSFASLTRLLGHGFSGATNVEDAFIHFKLIVKSKRKTLVAFFIQTDREYLEVHFNLDAPTLPYVEFRLAKLLS
jgi:hypothetical protein